MAPKSDYPFSQLIVISPNWYLEGILDHILRYFTGPDFPSVLIFLFFFRHLIGSTRKNSFFQEKTRSTCSDNFLKRFILESNFKVTLVNHCFQLQRSCMLALILVPSSCWLYSLYLSGLWFDKFFHFSSHFHSMQVSLPGYLVSFSELFNLLLAISYCQTFIDISGLYSIVGSSFPITDSFVWIVSMFFETSYSYQLFVRVFLGDLQHLRFFCSCK